ncbi:MAG: FKBP-type peptidyl-prolyl cis-trans isomerase [Alphaproteobacteria bacterium]|nr:FKBP-type peptidyl-prolyl cis-trans isomerase [Alphaproteobacteria bacterium]
MFDLIFKKRKPKATPPWAAWLVIAVVLYALFVNNRTTDKPQEQTSLPAPTTRETIESQVAPLQNLSSRLLPTVTTNLRVQDLKSGDGTPAVCGQTINLSYRSSLSREMAIEGADTPVNVSFVAGEGRVMPALERGVIGIKPGGQREVIASPDMAYDAPGYQRSDVPAGSSVIFTLELLSASPPMPAAGDTAFRIIDTQPGSGQIIFCGTRARVHVKIHDVRGKTIYDSMERGTILEFTPGMAQVFSGLEQGIIGMKTRGERLLIVPPEFHKTMKGNPPMIDIALPKNEIVLVEVTALP